MRYAYPCSIVRDEEEERATGKEAYTVTFPDVYGANTGGWSWEETLEMAKDCLGVALGMYVKAREDIPAPSPLTEGQVLVSVAPHRGGEVGPVRGDAGTGRYQRGPRRPRSVCTRTRSAGSSIPGTGPT